jgi:hypothetical protein
MLIFRDTTPERYETMDHAELRDSLDRWNAWIDDLTAHGRLQHANTLHPQARVVSARRVKPIDGPFAETKELVGGYFVLSARDLDEATAIAQQCPLLEYGLTVEVRPVAEACHLARALGQTTMRASATA